MCLCARKRLWKEFAQSQFAKIILRIEFLHDNYDNTVKLANWNTFGTEKNCSIESNVPIYQCPSNVSLWNRWNESVPI